MTFLDALVGALKSTPEAVVDGVRAAPAASVPVMKFMGYPVSDWTSLVMLVYALLLVGHLLYKFYARIFGKG
ncbi:hypothetical protein [Pandoraea sp. ISTKB]|uniref:hypothetical protein n=1 Tax=Pandoraea sp. ISTKB TaxID=1586708 RepID=UPI001112F134|nr:hypothetical protein [Pandoraea sp. ISTKB]